MTGDDKVRFCGQCDRNIYNIESMSAAEAATLMRNATERTCIRMFRRADGTLMTNDCPTGLRAYRQRVGRLVSAAFGVILGLFSIGNAQRIPSGDSTGIRSETFVDVPRIEGKVTDQTGASIEGALISVTNSSGKKITVRSDAKGRFELMDFRMLRGLNQLKVQSLGFQPFVDEFTITKREQITFPVVLEAGHMVGVIVVSSPSVVDVRKSSNSTRIILSDN